MDISKLLLPHFDVVLIKDPNLCLFSVKLIAE